MHIAVDIGNTCLKCSVLHSEKVGVPITLRIPSRGTRLSKSFLRDLLCLTMTDGYRLPMTWRIAPTGRFPWQVLQEEILKIRPRDQFKIITRKQIPLKIDVDAPKNVGVDRLLAAFGATKRYNDWTMLIVDAGTAITIDVVQDQTFCGGAILPGLTTMSETYPKISEKLPLVPIPEYRDEQEPPVYPYKNTEDAIRHGIYWGVVGAIRQFYEMRFTDTRLILTGGDANYLHPGLARVIPQRVVLSSNLVLEGIHQCFSK